MATQLFQFHTHPNDVAITQTEYVDDGLFFLDFGRPLEHLRWFGVNNRWIGPTIGLYVPVVHQGEESGGFVVGVHRGDPCFGNILSLWKERYPSKRSAPTIRAELLMVMANFGQQFPDSSQDLPRR